MDPAAFRQQFPVFEQTAYLNAGSCGPLPGAALRGAADVALQAAEEGRVLDYFLATVTAVDRLRAAYAAPMGAAAADVAVTTCTSEGLAAMIAALRLQPGDEVLTAPDEHPGLLGPLAAARRHLGVVVRTAPLAGIAEAVDPGTTKLVACSHVNWTTGALAPAALAEVGREVPVLLDGAQGTGALRFDVASLGCFAYAAAGQKWMCGPVGTGMLWVDPAWHERLVGLTPGYTNLAVPNDGLDADTWPDARAFDAPAISFEVAAAAAAAADVLDAFGWDAVFERAQELTAELVAGLTAAGCEVAPRDATTLVSWVAPDPAAFVARAAAAGVVVRPLPGTPYVRASVGAWNDASDLGRLLELV
ncbi:Cysteine desulfurase SufS [Paraconexibacter sp. AEG42_29]|uniref:Cysteine desulfurase SufS n=1 Tax=Paraconexibacter sp. AEG42_29 TaxID=2997339 RepID=A0AAU7AVE3_9ACTN